METCFNEMLNYGEAIKRNFDKGYKSDWPEEGVNFNAEVIKLTENVKTESQIDFRNEEHTIHLNSKTISNSTDLYDINVKSWSLISVKDGATVTIEGPGAIIAKENDCYAVDVRGGDLIINGGEFIGNITAVYVHDGTATINGGVYKIQQLDSKAPQGGYGYLLNCLDANYKNGTAKIIVKGGEFHNFDPAYNPEGTGTSYVAEGYESVQIAENIWKVQPVKKKSDKK